MLSSDPGPPKNSGEVVISFWVLGRPGLYCIFKYLAKICNGTTIVHTSQVVPAFMANVLGTSD